MIYIIAAAAGMSFLVTCKAKPPRCHGVIDILEDGLSLATHGIVDDEGVLLGFSPPPPRSRASPRLASWPANATVVAYELVLYLGTPQTPRRGPQPVDDIGERVSILLRVWWLATRRVRTVSRVGARDRKSAKRIEKQCAYISQS